MILNLILSEDNRVLGFANTAQPYTTTVEISQSLFDELTTNGHEGYFLENGQIIKKQSYLDLQQQSDNLDHFRRWRSAMLAKYDILRQCAINGDLDPSTAQPYSAITEAEKQWRVAVLNFTDQITHETTEADYPQPPERLR
jgi:hypothetical protein